jgi:hypothetical protein
MIHEIAKLQDDNAWVTVYTLLSSHTTPQFRLWLHSRFSYLYIIVLFLFIFVSSPILFPVISLRNQFLSHSLSCSCTP